MKNHFTMVAFLLLIVQSGWSSPPDSNAGDKSYTGKITVTTSSISVTWPRNYSHSNYFLDIRAWTQEVINGKTVQVQNAIYNFTKTTSGFSLQLKNPQGYLTYFATDTVCSPSAEFSSSLSSDHTYEGETMTGTAGEALVFGDFIYYKWSDKKWWKASASTYATARTRAIAVATIAANSSGTILIKGVIRDDTWNWTAAEVWLSTTSGTGTSTMPSTTGNQIQFLGTALNADTMLFDPSQDVGEK